MSTAVADRTPRTTGPYRFEVLKGVSHWVPEEAPEYRAELVVRHLAFFR